MKQLEKYQEERPWGKFEQFCKNEPCTVKIISVKPNSALSLQYHHHRNEFWRVIGGKGIVVIDGTEHEAIADKEFFIPKGAHHRIKTEDHAVQILEISFGQFDENDIVRLEDVYDRS